ncbi:Flavin reductase domain protein fmn-binding protein [Croceitalea dokdonensis DOKDO 023]|uniref:Flavin reductase domain protein fmn-binding protein n=1 Tax=Croceitalea dokdonensis DOKDO 023 TaxID=1300341 RepID=A0A0P7AUQ9_9FLAO|nr:flavin reductase [Croceitalea dokdonensis]KPM32264.1 Flavin reductase domain protein fmn-binding protein [Croceitalea dokdonensis DOKDO 023]
MSKHFTFDDIMQLPSRYRGNLMNKVSGFKPANLIGTKSKVGQTNLAVFNSVMHIGANPPYLGFILRPTTVERHTYENIKETGVYTINQITTKIHQQAHKTSAKYGRDVSEFDAVGLTEFYQKEFHAPFVEESRIKIGLSFQEEHLMQCNGTRLVIGKVEHLILPEEAILEDGDVVLEDLDTAAVAGLYNYYKPEHLGKYGYEKP